MKIRAHESFFIRKGWLSKGLKYVAKDAEVFVSKEYIPGDVLGIGTNMVKSLRYWMQAVGLTEESRSGKRRQTFTGFGLVVKQYDQYIEESGTLAALHYKLAKNEGLATSWYYFFNEFNLNEFSKDDFVQGLDNYLKMKGFDKRSEKSLEDDFNCIINTYIPRNVLSPDKQQPESNIDCPLGELGLLAIVDRKKKVYRKSVPTKEVLPDDVMMAALADFAKGKKEIRISEIQNNPLGIGRIYNLDTINLMNILHSLEQAGYINVIRTAGLDVIRLLANENNTYEDYIESYYKKLED